MIYGPEAEIPYPDGTNELDYELEVAAVIGADGQIGGFTIMNDWSARDVQREEMKVGLGPAKGKDFATSLGPVVVTPDEFDGSSAVMVARVNGEERSRGNLADLYHPWDRIVEQAGWNTELWPGTSSAPEPSGPAASSSTATGAGSSRATRSSSRWRGSASSVTRSARGNLRAMPTYQVRGDVPRKRHIQFRDNGSLLTEEVMGLEGFTGNESILYHLTSPCRIKELGDFEPIKREEWVPDAHAHRHFKTIGIEPEGDEISGRKLLMWNNDVEISLVRPSESMDYFFRNGEGEVYFVHEGTGTLHTTFGDLPYKEGDYVVIPRGTTYTFEPSGPQRYLLFETPGLIEIPKRYGTSTGS